MLKSKLKLSFNNLRYGNTLIEYNTNINSDLDYWELKINNSLEMTSETAIVYESAFKELLSLIKYKTEKPCTKNSLIIGGGDLQLLECISCQRDFLILFDTFEVLDPLANDLPDFLDYARGTSRESFLRYFNDLSFIPYTFDDYYKQLLSYKSPFDLIVIDVSDPLTCNDISSPVYSEQFLCKIKPLLSEDSYVIVYRGDIDSEFLITDSFIKNSGYNILKTIFSGYGNMSLLKII